MTAPRRLARDERGGVAIMTAASLVAACAAAALAVDLGSVALTARRAQGAADLAALAAARDLSRAGAAAQATARDNLKVLTAARAVTGAYSPDRSRPPEERFTPGGEANAARVEVTTEAPLFFGRWILGKDQVQVTRAATAAVRGAGQPSATFSIGSRLARLDAGLANQLLSALTGSRASLTVMDYQGLASAQVNLLSFTDALATDLGLNVGDYDRLLDHRVEAGRVLTVLERLLDGSGQTALGKLTRSPAGAVLRIGDLIGAEADARAGLRQGLDTTVSALDLAMATLETANGDRQLALDVGARAGLADLDLWLAIGERPNRSPWLAVTADGEPVIRTAQARLYLEALTSQKLAGLSQVRLPILVELAPSEARLAAISCPGPRAVELEARPGVARARLGTIDPRRLGDFKKGLDTTPATLVSVLRLVTIKGRADLQAADAGWTRLRFDAGDIEGQAMKTATSRHFVDGLVVSLLRDLETEVELGVLGVGLGDLLGPLAVLLRPLGPVLDGVIQPVLDLVGLRLGEADVRVHGAVCPARTGAAPVLVG